MAREDVRRPEGPDIKQASRNPSGRAPPFVIQDQNVNGSIETTSQSYPQQPR
jgi:hypothetical protein